MPDTDVQDRRHASYLARLDERLGYHRDSLGQWQSGYLNPTEPDLMERDAIKRELRAAIRELEKAREDFLGIYGGGA